MDMHTTIPITYFILFMLLLIAGIVGCLVRSCCVCLDKDEKRKVAQANAQPDPDVIVVDPTMGAISKSIHRVPKLQGPSGAPVHSSGLGNSKSIFTVSKPSLDINRIVTYQPNILHLSSSPLEDIITCTSMDPSLRSGIQGRPASLPTNKTIVDIPALQRKPKIRRTGEYDDLYSMSSKSYSI